MRTITPTGHYNSCETVSKYSMILIKEENVWCVFKVLDVNENYLHNCISFWKVIKKD